MGLGDLFNDIGDGLENLAQGAEHVAGQVVDGGAHLLGDGLNAVGLHNAAGAVDDFGDSVADHLGDQVPEKQLGQTDDPTQLIHGDVGAITQTATRLGQFADAFGETATGLAGIDTAHWSGAASGAFHAAYQQHPRQWSDARDACATASAAWQRYGQAVAGAQSRAQQAIALYQRSQQDTQQAQARYNQAVDTYWAQFRAYVGSGGTAGPMPQHPAPFADPGAADRQHAQDLLSTARQHRDTAAGQAQQAISGAIAHAPTTPSFGQRMLDDASDAVLAVGVEGEHVVGGALKGVGDLGKLVRSVAPVDPYNLTHPAEYVDGLSSTAAGLIHSAQHPADLVHGLVGTDWGSDPAQALGHLVPNLVGVVGTDGASSAASEAADLANVADAATATQAAQTVERVSGVGHAGAGLAESGSAATSAGDTGQAAFVAPRPPVVPGLSLNPADMQGIAAGLGTVERDLATIHVHTRDTTTVAAAPSHAGTHLEATAPARTHPAAEADGMSTLQQRLAGLDSPTTPEPPTPSLLDDASGDTAASPQRPGSHGDTGNGDTDGVGSLASDPRVHADLTHTAMHQPDLSVLDRSDDPIVWRRDHDTLYRGGNRGPAVFHDGFTPRDMTQLDLRSHVVDNTPSGYTSTTRNPLYWQTWGSGAQYFYEIEAPGGIDINASLGSQYDYEQEIAMPGGLQGERVKGLWPVMRDPTSLRPFLGDYVPNPHYRPLPAPGR